jgi:hypothetical protein
MADYCAKQYKHFTNGLMNFYDPVAKRFMSEYLDKN